MIENARLWYCSMSGCASVFWWVSSNWMPAQGMIVCSPGMFRLSRALRTRCSSTVPALLTAWAAVITAVNADAAASVIWLLKRRW